MCTTVWYKNEDEVSSVGEIKRFCESLIIHDGDLNIDDLSDNDCLCPLDVRKTLENAGYEVTEDGSMPGDLVFYPVKALADA